MDTVCSGLVVYGGGDIVFHAKRSNQWIQQMQSHSRHSTQWIQWMHVHSGCSGRSTQWTKYTVDTVDIVFDVKMSNQWIQWMQSHSVHSTQWMQWTQYAVDALRSGHSRIVVYGGGDIVSDTKRSKWMQWMQ